MHFPIVLGLPLVPDSAANCTLTKAQTIPASKGTGVDSARQRAATQVTPKKQADRQSGGNCRASSESFSRFPWREASRTLSLEAFPAEVHSAPDPQPGCQGSALLGEVPSPGPAMETAGTSGYPKPVQAAPGAQTPKELWSKCHFLKEKAGAGGGTQPLPLPAPTPALTAEKSRRRTSPTPAPTDKEGQARARAALLPADLPEGGLDPARPRPPRAPAPRLH